MKFTVIFLAILIFICFAFLLYGLYSKISNTQVSLKEQTSNYSLNLNNSQKIKDIKIINEKNLILVISDNDQLTLFIYNLDQNKIISKIGR